MKRPILSTILPFTPTIIIIISLIIIFSKDIKRHKYNDNSNKIPIRNSIFVVDDEYNIDNKSRLFKRIYFFLKNKKVDNPYEWASLLESCPWPRLMTAIAFKESGFNSCAVGKNGELSAFQILKWPKDLNPRNNKIALVVACDHFGEKLQSARSFTKAIERYNGAGPQAIKYRKDILKIMKQI